MPWRCACMAAAAWLPPPMPAPIWRRIACSCALASACHQVHAADSRARAPSCAVRAAARARGAAGCYLLLPFDLEVVLQLQLLHLVHGRGRRHLAALHLLSRPWHTLYCVLHMLLKPHTPKMFGGPGPCGRARRLARFLTHARQRPRRRLAACKAAQAGGMQGGAGWRHARRRRLAACKAAQVGGMHGWLRGPRQGPATRDKSREDEARRKAVKVGAGGHGGTCCRIIICCCCCCCWWYCCWGCCMCCGCMCGMCGCGGAPAALPA